LQSVPDRQSLGWSVSRNTNNTLPVYSHYRLNKIVTRVRHFRGDQQALMLQLEQLTGEKAIEHAGRIEIKGKWVFAIKAWLEKIGF
jgi:hypothetical protein